MFLLLLLLCVVAFVVVVVVVVIIIIIINLIDISQFYCNGIHTTLYIVIKYKQTQYIHTWAYMN